MNIKAIKASLTSLSSTEILELRQALEQMSSSESPLPKSQQSRRHLLDNKLGSCPHCGHNKYVKFGVDKGSQGYKCKSCNRSFTEYTGTWMAGLQRKDKIDDYLVLMHQEKSLDKIREAISINKKTAFDWRHKILAAIQDDDQDDFTGITESDETFFLASEKGRTVTDRDSRKRGGKSQSKGISNDQVAVIVTQDRKSSLSLSVVTMGRIKKVDIEKAIGSRINKDQTILCSDAHVSYKGFAMDNNLEHHTLKGIIKQRVKDHIYHIQQSTLHTTGLKSGLTALFGESLLNIYSST